MLYNIFKNFNWAASSLYFYMTYVKGVIYEFTK